MYCAWCGTQVPAVSYEPCPRCGNPTNGAPRTAAVAPRQSNTALIVIVVAVLVLVLLAIGGIVAAIAIPNLLTATQRAKQKRTMADIRTLATAVESYATDKNEYPKVQSVSELAPLIVPTYVKTVPTVDGWGRPFRYACTAEEQGRCTGYALGSGGKDGVFQNDDLRSYATSPPGSTTNFDCDIVYSNGKFAEYPEGVQH